MTLPISTILAPAPRSVLVMRALLGLGDFLCVTPALRALRAALPEARIVLLGLPATRGLVARFPHLVDEFLAFPGFPGLPEAPAEVTALPGFLRAVQGRFDLALQMHGSGLVSNTFVQLLGARAAAGFYAPPCPCPDPARFARYPAGLPEPRVWLALLEFLGAPARGEQLEFPPGAGPSAAATLSTLGIAPDLPLALLHLGASEPPRRLSPRIFAEVGDHLAARGLQVAVTGTADEASLTAAVRGHARRPLLDLTGRTDLDALGALMRHARLVVSSDTGISHLASALQTPSVVVFLASDVQRWAPLDRVRHRVVDARRAPPTAEAILLEVDALLAAIAPRPRSADALRPPSGPAAPERALDQERPGVPAGETMKGLAASGHEPRIQPMASAAVLLDGPARCSPATELTAPGNEDRAVPPLAAAVPSPSAAALLDGQARRSPAADLTAPGSDDRARPLPAAAVPSPSAAVLRSPTADLTAHGNEDRVQPLPAAAVPSPSAAVLRSPTAELTAHGNEDRTTPLPAAARPDLRAARRVLVVAPAGPQAEFEPALSRLRAALPAATLVLLAGDPPVDPALVDSQISVAGSPLQFLEIEALQRRLAVARLDLALVFTADGDTAFDLAYLAYLAAVPVRAGIGGEFGGAVLAPCVSPPPGPLWGCARHLFLLDQLGL